MHTALSLTVSRSIRGACMPHMPPPPHIPPPYIPAMHTPCHACPLPHMPPAMHAPHHAHPLPCMPPAMHAPHHAHPLPHMPPAMHAPLPRMPSCHTCLPAMYASCHADPYCYACPPTTHAPLPRMPPCHANPPPPCTGWLTDACEILPCCSFVAGGKNNWKSKKHNPAVQWRHTAFLLDCYGWCVHDDSSAFIMSY